MPAPNLSFFAASWVLPISAPPIRNGAVVLSGDRIVEALEASACKQKYPNAAGKNYGEAIILPGLINLHTHLDISAARCSPELPLFEWIPRMRNVVNRWNEESWRQSALLGARLAAASGTTCVADCSFSGGPAANALAEVGLRGVVGLEVFGLESARAETFWADWLRRMAALENRQSPELVAARKAGRVRLSVSPHSPYTVCPALWALSLDWAKQNRLPLLTHLAESIHECNWIASQDDVLDNFITRPALKDVLGNISAGPVNSLEWRSRGNTPVEHLDSYGLLHEQTVAAHAVHLSDHDQSILASRRVKIAHCPRSNARLQNGAAKLSQMLASGISVGLGTDGLPSNDDLSLLSEARFCWYLHRAITPAFNCSAESLVLALTLEAARALGLEHEIGSLEPGKKADLAVFAIDNQGADVQSPYDLLLFQASQALETFVDGRIINLH